MSTEQINTMKQSSMFEGVPAARPVETDRPRRRRLKVVQQPLLRHLDPELDDLSVEAEQLRPRTRGDCETAVGDGPCPFVSCKMHLWSDAFSEEEDGSDPEKLPRRTRWFEHLVETVDPEDWGETCAFRVAERVVLRPSETGKWEGHSSDGEVIGIPGPVLSGDQGRREWQPVDPEFASPKKVDAAVLGRFLGGLSREQIRKDLNSATAAIRSDDVIREFVTAMGLDPDKLLRA